MKRFFNLLMPGLRQLLVFHNMWLDLQVEMDMANRRSADMHTDVCRSWESAESLMDDVGLEHRSRHRTVQGQEGFSLHHNKKESS